MNINKAIDLFLERYNPATAKIYRYCLNQFIEMCAIYQVYDCSQLTNDLAVKFIKQVIANGSSKRTEQHRKAVVSTFYKWLVDNDIVSFDIYELRKAFRLASSNKDKIAVGLDKGTVELFLTKLPPLLSQELTYPQRFLYLRDCALFYLLAHSGLRVAEASNLRYKQLDIKEQCLNNVIVKGGDNLSIPVTSQALKHISNYIAEHPKNQDDFLFNGRRTDRIKPRGIQRRLEWYSEIMNLSTKITPHMFRHYFLTVIDSHGGVHCANHYANHKNINVTKIYIHNKPSIPTLDEIFQAERKKKKKEKRSAPPLLDGGFA